MLVPFFQVDAFTRDHFRGNPAAVCLLEEPLDDSLLQNIAAENNLSETAFTWVENEKRILRWFTPVREVDLSGHATLATAHVFFTELTPKGGAVTFWTKSGPIPVVYNKESYIMDFPADTIEEHSSILALEQALGQKVLKLFKGRYWSAILESDANVREAKTASKELVELGIDAVIISAEKNEGEVVCRFFAPGYGIEEDPVTGSAFCTLMPYWTQQMKRDRLLIVQHSRRGGEAICVLAGDRVLITGNATTLIEGVYRLP